MTNEDLLNKVVGAIYEEPLTRMREDGSIRDLSNPVCVIALISDFEIERDMNGIFNCLGNQTGRYLNETASAFKHIGDTKTADRVQRIIDAAASIGMDHKSIQTDRNSQELYSVTNWQDTHGNKWDKVEDDIIAADREIDFDGLYELLVAYVGSNHERICSELGITE